MYGPLVKFAREVRNEMAERGQLVTAESVAHEMMHRDETLDAFYMLNANPVTVYAEAVDADPRDLFILRIHVIRFVAVVVTNENNWIH